MLEFKVNKYISLKLQGADTTIYIDNEEFNQCTHLFLNIPEGEIKEFDEIRSIDEAVEKLNLIPGDTVPQKASITPEAEFWGHCSNLQVWAENDYDTRLLHSNLSFPLLKKLTEAGDPTAKKIFKEEIAMRFTSFHLPVMLYLLTEGYLNYLNSEEFETIMENLKSSNISRKEILFWAIYYLVYIEKGEDDKANEAYNNVIALKFDSKYEEVWVELGDAYYNKGKINNAITIYKKILEIKPENESVILNLSGCYNIIGEYNNGIRLLKHFLEINPDFEMGWYKLGDIYFLKKNLIKAEEIYKRVLERNNNLPLIWEALGTIYEFKGEIEKEIEAFSHALAIEPEHYILWYNLGVSYIELKRYNRAIDAFKRSLEIDKTFEDAWELLGYAYGQIEEYEKEIEAYLKALEYGSELESIWYNLGLAYYGKGDYDKAKDAFMHVLHINPDNEDAQEGLDEIYNEVNRSH